MGKTFNKRGHSNDRKESRNGSSHPSRRSPIDQRPDHSSQPMSENQLFAIDRKGDIQNVKFGEPDRYKVPRFRQDGRGRLIGLDDRYRIEKELGTQSQRYVHDASFDGGRRNRKTSLITETEPAPENQTTSLKPVHGRADSIALQSNYILLGTKRRRLSENVGESDSDSETILQQNFEFSVGKKLSGERSPEIKGQQDYERFRDDTTHRRHLELQRATEQDPQDIDSWLSLISLQEDLFLSRVGEAKQLTAKERNIVCEIRVSIYRTAVGKVSDRRSKEKLKLGLVKEGSKIWDYSKQAETWNSLLDESASVDLHIEFLNFLQANILSFSVDSCLEQYIRCFGMIQELSNSVPDQDEQFSYLVLRLTSFLVETGYVERALGTWQALLELNFRKPVNLSEDQLTSRFEEFWNFDAFRIGEEGAHGFDAIVWSRPPPRDDPKAPLLQDSQAVLKQWSQTEHMLSEKSPLPARLLDGTSEDDPFRNVTFSDIKPFSCHIVSESNLEFLIQAFLQFANLPPLFGTQFEIHRVWRTDPYCITYNPVRTSSTVEDPGTECSKPPFAHCLPDTAALFVRQQDWFSPWPSANITPHPLSQFFMNVVIQLTMSRYLSNCPRLFSVLAEYAIALQLQHDPAKARKLAKSLLKKHPENFRLYNAYALIEHHLGNNEASEKAWSAALSMKEDVLEKDLNAKILLWHTWILKCLDKVEEKKALSLISMIPTERTDSAAIEKTLSSTNMTPAVRLRTKQYLLSHYQRLLQKKDQYLAVLIADLLATFAYLVSGKAFNEMEQTYQSILEEASKSGPYQGLPIILEHLHQNHVLLVHYHTKTSPSYRPRDIIQALHHSYQQFPDNTVIWSLYQYHSQRAGLIDRLRDTSLIDTVRTNENHAGKSGYSDNDSHRAISYLFSITSELSRPSYAGSTAHSIRAAFNRAAENDSPLHHSPSFWEAWLKWEIEQAASLSHMHPATGKRRGKNGQDVAAVKHKYVLETLHCAIRACPWVKGLYMIVLGSEKLEDILGFDEAKGVYDSMMERGLRIRYDVSDKLDDLF